MYDVIGIGQPLMDICCKVSEEFLKEQGLNKGQFHMADKELFTKVHDNLDKENITLDYGGSVANTLAGMKLIDYDIRLAEYGMLGKDEYGKLEHAKLKQQGISDYYKDHEELPTGTVLALITPDAERTFVVYLGAAPELEAEYIDTDIFENVKIIHTTGYEFESLKVRTAIRKAVAVAKDNGNMVSFDLADPGVVQRNMIDIKAFVKENVDILFANEEEVMEFTGKEPQEAIEELSEMVDYVIVKLGEKGSMIIDNEGVHYEIDAFKVDAKDTTGAGDMFAAGILWGISKEIDLNVAGKIASFAASKVVEKIGARLNDLEIDEFLE